MPDLIPTTDIVPLAELKDALNVTLDVDDDKLGRKIEAARDFLEGWVGPLDAYETAEKVPDALREALKLHAGHLYDNDAAEVPPGFFALIGAYRKWVFGETGDGA